MKHNYNATGTQRKRLVGIVSKAAGMEAQYQFTPTCAYEIGPFTVDREGALIYDDSTIDVDLAIRVLEAIEEEGFREQEDKAEEQAASPDRLIIQIPRDKVDTGKLANLLEAKGYLIEKALGTDDLPVEIGEESVSFPWFAEMPDADTTAAYTNFITALCRMTLEQKRISATEKPAKNEKYAFRCFLLRLGFIGDEYKRDRKILLQRLTGSSAFKARKEAHDEISA